MRNFVSSSEQVTSAAQTFQTVLFIRDWLQQLVHDVSQNSRKLPFPKPSQNLPILIMHRPLQASIWTRVSHIYRLWSGRSHETKARSPPPKPKHNIETKCKLQQEPGYLHVSTKHAPGRATAQLRLPLRVTQCELTLLGWSPLFETCDVLCFLGNASLSLGTSVLRCLFRMAYNFAIVLNR